MLESGDWNHLTLGTCGIYATHCWHRKKKETCIQDYDGFHIEDYAQLCWYSGLLVGCLIYFEMDSLLWGLDTFQLQFIYVYIYMSIFHDRPQYNQIQYNCLRDESHNSRETVQSLCLDSNVAPFLLPLLGAVWAGPQDSCMLVSKFLKQAVTHLILHHLNVPGTMECSCTKVRGCCLVPLSCSPISTQ